jgi:hypothetical protein
MADLASLIATAQKAVAAQAAIKVAKVTAKARPTPEALSALHALELQVQWRPVALVLKLEEWTCVCGHQGEHPLGLFLLEEHTRVANSTRLSRPRNEAELPPLPRRIAWENGTRLICSSCAPRHGFLKELTRAPVAAQAAVPPAKGEFTSEWETLRGNQDRDTDGE